MNQIHVQNSLQSIGDQSQLYTVLLEHKSEKNEILKKLENLKFVERESNDVVASLAEKGNQTFIEIEQTYNELKKRRISQESENEKITSHIASLTVELKKTNKKFKYFQCLYTLQRLSQKIDTFINNPPNQGAMAFIDDSVYAVFVKPLKLFEKLTKILLELEYNSSCYNLKKISRHYVRFWGIEMHKKIERELNSFLVSTNYPTQDPWKSPNRNTSVKKILDSIQVALELYDLLENCGQIQWLHGEINNNKIDNNKKDNVYRILCINDNNNNNNNNDNDNINNNNNDNDNGNDNADDDSQEYGFIIDKKEKIPEKLATQLLLNPVMLRFEYHFYGKRETNKIEKPEWFMSFVLRFLKDQNTFLTNVVQSIFNYDFDDNKADSFIVMNWAAAKLVEDCIKEKLRKQMPKYLKNADLFKHVISEAINFDTEMREKTHIPFDFPLCIEVFTEDQEIFRKWIMTESETSYGEYKKFKDKDNALEFKFREVTEDTKLTHFGANIINLLQSVLERFRILKNEQQKLDFIKDVILRILDQFVDDIEQRIQEKHIRLSNVDDIETYCRLICTVHFVYDVIREWADEQVFVDIYTNIMLRDFDVRQNNERNFATDDDMIGSVFDDILKRFNLLNSKMNNSLAQEINANVSQKLTYYAKQRWVLTKQEQLVSPFISESLSAPLTALHNQISVLNNTLPQSIVDFLWPIVAKNISQSILRQVISANYFNGGGAKRFTKDMDTVFEVFNEFTAYPERHLPEVSDSCKILNMNQDDLSKLKGFKKNINNNPNPDEVYTGDSAVEGIGTSTKLVYYDNDNDEAQQFLKKANIHFIQSSVAIDIANRFV